MTFSFGEELPRNAQKKKTTTIIVVVLPTLHSVWIADGSIFANVMTTIHPAGVQAATPQP